MKLVIIIEGGIVQNVLDLDTKKEVRFEVLDYDVFDDGGAKRHWELRTKRLRDYLKKYLPDEHKRFQEAIREEEKEGREV